jgi:hypothetical protein
MKRFFVSETGSMGSMEGLMLALFAVALIVGIRFALFPSKPAPTKKASVSASRPEPWPKLPSYEPISTVNPLR